MAKKNWFKRHKILTAIIVLIIIAGIAGAAGGNKNNNSSSNTNASTSGSNHNYRFTDRADKQKSDIEVLPGETATINGVKMTINSVKYATSLDEFTNADSGKTYLIANVTLQNTGNSTKPYNEFDFRVQTVSGQVLDSDITPTNSPLNSGDLVSGGKVSGEVGFQVPIEKGHEYIIWKPGFDPDRAVIQTSQS